MASPRLLSCAALLVALAPGCVFFSDDDDCRYGLGGGYDQAPAVGQRNPETGVCEYFGGGGGGGCGDPCYPCPGTGASAEAAQAAPPTWGYCESQCTGLDEESCVDASGCRAIYVNSFYSDGPPVYAECWSTDMTGPIEGGSCEGLDSTTCSMHDDCSAVHNQACEGGAPEPCPTGAFAYCTAEGGDPRTGTCDGEVVCERATPACPDGTTPGISGGCYTGYCIPVGDCDSPGGAGLCYAPVNDDQVPPACPDGTTPGIGADGRYTGYCIPLEECEAQPACGEIAAEATCIARTDCTPIYRGEDCSCDQAGACTCAVWNYDHCQ